jgi:hypothetical protein
MWKSQLWKNRTKILPHKGCGKPDSFPQVTCGEKVPAALRQNGLFHIKIHYYHYYYLIYLFLYIYF